MNKEFLDIVLNICGVVTASVFTACVCALMITWTISAILWILSKIKPKNL